MGLQKVALDSDTLHTWQSYIVSGNMAAIESSLLSKKLTVHDELGLYKLSPLHLAAWYNQPKLCELLLSQKIHPNVKESFSGKTPLHIAAYYGYKEVAKVLVHFHLETKYHKIADILGCHPLHYAALGEHKNMIYFFLEINHILFDYQKRKEFFAGKPSLIGNILDILIRQENFELSDLVSSSEGISIVETNPRIYSTTYIGYTHEYQWTPFHSAAAIGDIKTFEMLLKKFPYAYCLSKDFQKYFDWSPREIAILQGHTDIARLLPAFTDYQSKRFSCQPNTPPHCIDIAQAIQEGTFEQIEQIIEKYGIECLYHPCFAWPSPSQYEVNNNLTALSLVSRLFSFQFAEWASRKNIQINPQEFLRDNKESVFFNWAMMKINPYATGFFQSLEKLLKLPT